MSRRCGTPPKLPGVERLIKRWEISGTDAMDVRDWAEAAMCWNAMFLLDPADIAVILCGAKDSREFETKLREYIERRLAVKP